MTKNDLKQFLSNTLKTKYDLTKFKRKKWNEELLLLYEYTNQLPTNITLKERIILFSNDMDSPPLCKECNKEPTKFDPNKGKYRHFCSVSCSIKNNETRKKFINTCNKKYGVSNPSKSQKIKQKIQKTFQQKYNGGHPARDKHVVAKRMKTNLKRYGVNHYFQTKELIEKNKQKSRIINRNNHTLLNDFEWLKTQYINKNRSCHSISIDCNVHPETIRNRLIEYNIERRFNSDGKSSSFENDIAKIVKECENNVVTNDKNIIYPYELDILIPNKNMAIECCGIHWHSNLYKSKNYHKQKYDLCKEKGIQLLTIFEDEWIYKNDIVTNMIKYKLKNYDNDKTYARNCVIKNVSKNKKKQFLTKNHIQGNCSSSIDIGLFEKETDELVCLMCFIKRKNNEYELIRFVSSKIVPGGFSKLLNYFENTYIKKGDKIISFSDNRWSSGNLYIINGFYKDKDLLPDYRYVIGKKTYHKFNFRKKAILNKFQCGDSSMSESELAKINNLKRIYDCGKQRFIKIK